MDSIQSQINIIEARIRQYKESDFYSEEEKTRLIQKEEIALEKLLLQKADDIVVNNPEILS